MSSTQIQTPTRINAPVALATTGYAVAADDMIIGSGATPNAAVEDAVAYLTDANPEAEIDRDNLIARPVTAAALANTDNVSVCRGTICVDAERDAVDDEREARRTAWEQWIAEKAPTWPLPPFFRLAKADESTYRRALSVMAMAYAEGNDKVHLSHETRVPLWSRKEENRGWLSPRVAEMCQELGEGVGDWSFKKILIDRPVAYLRAVGLEIYGGDWIGPMAKRLDVDTRTVQRWNAGEHGIPAGVLDELKSDAVTAVARAKARIALLQDGISTYS